MQTLSPSKPVRPSELEPGWLEICLTILAGDLFGRIYQSYIDRLPLKGSERVLELGPAAGNATRCLAKRLLAGGGRVTAVDISPRWVEIAKKRLRRYPNVDVRLANLAAQGLAAEDRLDEIFDAAFIHFVVHDIPAGQRGLVLKAVATRLAPGGRLYLREPLRFISPPELRALLLPLGFEELHTGLETVPTQGPAWEGIYAKG